MSKKHLFFILVLFTTLVAKAQYYSGNVGDYISLPDPTPPSGWQIYNAQFWTTSSHLDVASGTNRVKILSYFSGYEIVQCDYYVVRQYTVAGKVYESYNNLVAYYYISCSSNPDSGSGTDDDSNVSTDPWDYHIDKGCWGTIDIDQNSTKIVYNNYTIPNWDQVKSIRWVRNTGDYGYEITYQDEYKCQIKGLFQESDTKLWCLMNYGTSASYKAYYIINVKPVSNPDPTAITLPASKTIKVGETFTMTYTLSPTNATTTLTWTSDDTSIATVSSAGVVKGIKAGTTKIRVQTANGKTDWCNVTVEAIVDPTSITLPYSKTVKVGETFTMTYTLSPSNATTTLTWTSDDTGIATVSSAGVVKGIKIGSTYINVKTANGKTDYCKVIVEANNGDGTLANPFNAIGASQKASELAIGETSTQSYYVKGIVSAIKYYYSAQYGTATFYISDNGGTTTNQFYVYCAYYLENRPWVDGNPQIAIGDNLILYGKLANYEGTFEMANKENYIYSHNGKTAIGNGSYSIKLSNDGYATFYDSKLSYTLPSGLTAQVVNNVSNNKLTYKTTSNIPKGTAVMLKGNSSQTYVLTATENVPSYSGTNLLRGSDVATTTTGNGYHYKLSYGQSGSNLSNVFGWYWGAANGGSFQIEGHKAWLVVPNSSGARSFTIEGDATGIASVNSDEKEAVLYDLQGRRLNGSCGKGIYIKNGKKVIIK